MRRREILAHFLKIGKRAGGLEVQGKKVSLSRVENRQPVGSRILQISAHYFLVGKLAENTRREAFRTRIVEPTEQLNSLHFFIRIYFTNDWGWNFRNFKTILRMYRSLRFLRRWFCVLKICKMQWNLSWWKSKACYSLRIVKRTIPT